MSVDEMEGLVGQSLRQRYAVEELVGGDELAEVYDAWDRERRCYVAIKIVREEVADDTELLRRFRREVQALQSLEDGSLVRFHGLEREGRRLFAVLDYEGDARPVPASPVPPPARLPRWIWAAGGLVLAGSLLLAVLVVAGIARDLALAPEAPSPATTAGQAALARTPAAPFLPTATLTPLAPEATVAVSPTLAPAPEEVAPTEAAASPISATPTHTEAATATAAATATEPPPSPTAEPPTPTPRPPAPTAVPPTSTPLPRPGWIAFETKRGAQGDYEVFVMGTDGSRVSNLTNSWADDVAPAWSPDGRRIAFVSLRDTAMGDWDLEKPSIYIMDFDPVSGTTSGAVRRLTDDGGKDGWPTWSPDGKRIAFHSDRGGNWDIWAINVDGSGLVRLTDHPANDRYPDWSPNGKRIAFTSKRTGDEDVWLMNADGANPVNITAAPGYDRYPLWSPDGLRLSFNTNRDGNYEVYVINADGSNPVNVSQSPGSTEGLADWSPNGQRLVTYSNRTDNKEIYIVNLASGQWTNISNHPANDEFCSWSP